MDNLSNKTQPGELRAQHAAAARSDRLILSDERVIAALMAAGEDVSGDRIAAVKNHLPVIALRDAHDEGTVGAAIEVARRAADFQLVADRLLGDAVLVKAGVLARVVEAAESEVEDVETGLDTHLYDPAENPGIDQHRRTVDAIAAACRVASGEDVSVSRRDLAIVIDLAATHVEEVRSGIESGDYSSADNPRLPFYKMALDVVKKVYGSSALIPTEKESGVLKQAFKDVFREHGIGGKLSADLSALKDACDPEWSEACQEFEQETALPTEHVRVAVERDLEAVKAFLLERGYKAEVVPGAVPGEPAAILRVSDGEAIDEDGLHESETAAAHLWSLLIDLRDGVITRDSFADFGGHRCREVIAASSDAFRQYLDPSSRLAALVDLHADDCLFTPDLEGYAAHVAAKELVDSWQAALANGDAGHLIADVDRVITLLGAFRDRAVAILPEQNVGEPKKQQEASLDI